jgi:hypothetical protein
MGVMVTKKIGPKELQGLAFFGRIMTTGKASVGPEGVTKIDFFYNLVR